jgi:hypothetical protein
MMKKSTENGGKRLRRRGELDEKSESENENGTQDLHGGLTRKTKKRSKLHDIVTKNTNSGCGNGK